VWAAAILCTGATAEARGDPRQDVLDRRGLLATFGPWRASKAKSMPGSWWGEAMKPTPNIVVVQDTRGVGNYERLAKAGRGQGPCSLS